MTLSGYFMLKFVFSQQGCRALTFALSRLSCYFSRHDICHLKKQIYAYLVRERSHSLVRPRGTLSPPTSETKLALLLSRGN